MVTDTDIIPENEQQEPLQRGNSSMSIGSDMSSISSYNHSKASAQKDRFSALSSTTTISETTPVPSNNEQPKNLLFAQQRDKKQKVIKLQTTSNAPRSSLAVFNQKANKTNIPQPNVSLRPIESSAATIKTEKEQKATTTPIAYSSIDKATGALKSSYRFVLNDRNKEIALGDIVKAPIPKKLVHVKLNAIVKEDDDDGKEDNVRIVTDDQYTSHYVGIVRYLGTTKMKSKNVVTFLGLELVCCLHGVCVNVFL